MLLLLELIGCWIQDGGAVRTCRTVDFAARVRTQVVHQVSKRRGTLKCRRIEKIDIWKGLSFISLTPGAERKFEDTKLKHSFHWAQLFLCPSMLVNLVPTMGVETSAGIGFGRS